MNEDGYIIYDRHVVGFGSNYSGQLPKLFQSHSNSHMIDLPSHYTPQAVYCGTDTSFVVLDDNTLLATGLNDSGQLGVGDFDNRNEFEVVVYDSIFSRKKRIKDIAFGFSFTLLLTGIITR